MPVFFFFSLSRTTSSPGCPLPCCPPPFLVFISYAGNKTQRRRAHVNWNKHSARRSRSSCCIPRVYVRYISITHDIDPCGVDFTRPVQQQPYLIFFSPLSPGSVNNYYPGEAVARRSTVFQQQSLLGTERRPGTRTRVLGVGGLMGNADATLCILYLYTYILHYVYAVSREPPFMTRNRCTRGKPTNGI